jgi:hypothetical protein
MSKFQLHVSGLNMISKCGVQFERRYVNGEKIPPSVAIVIGTATDKSVTADLGHKIETGGALLADGDVQDIARDALKEEWRAGVKVTEDDQEDGIGSEGGAIDASVKLALLHHKQAAPDICPTHVQRQWTLDVEGLPIQLAGTIDIQEGMSAIRDTKTSGKSPAKDAADTSLQLTTYALAVRQHDGAVPGMVALDYLVRTKVPKLVQIESQRSEKDFPHLLERVAQASRMIEAGLFMPAPIEAWWCSAKWCGYHDKCKYAAKPVSVGIRGLK